MQNINNDYSLLREFNLEQAKNGEILCSSTNAYNFYKFLGYSNTSNKVSVQSVSYMDRTQEDFMYICSPNDLRMAPLCWVEGKPVYKGNVLYSKMYSDLRYDVISFEDGLIYTETNETEACCEYPYALTWEKPKEKRTKKIWVNVYPEGNVGTLTFSTEKEAIYHSSSNKAKQVEVEVSWEE